MQSQSGLDLAKACAAAAADIKAENISIFEVKGLSSITDYIVLCTTGSVPQQRAVVREIEKQIQEAYGTWPSYAENAPESMWSVLDYIDVMVHVMGAEIRETYKLEKLWADGVQIKLD